MGQELNYVLFGKRVCSRRKALHITQRALASMLDCTPTHVSNIENNYTKPSLKCIMRICSILEVTPDYLLLGIDRMGGEEDDRLEIQDKLCLCTKEQRHLVSRFLDVFIEENQAKQQ